MADNETDPNKGKPPPPPPPEFDVLQEGEETKVVSKR